MSFLFKSKRNQDRGLSSRDGPPPGAQGGLGGASARLAREEKSSLQRSTPTGSLNSLDNDGSAGSPDQGYGRRPQTQPQSQAVNGNGNGNGTATANTDAGSQQADTTQYRNGAPVSNPNAALYPWSQRRLTYTSSHPSPFPRYGAAVNATSSKEGDIYVMGGLINSQTVKGDLWMIEAGGNMSCYPLATTAEGPGPRVGHSSLLVGNAFIVYGGDTKIDENDVLDETLYLLNTSTRQWSRSLPAGPRPCGRYGHSLNILGSKIYIFGGQVEGYFMNDLAAFDLNQLQMPNNRWEMLLPNTDTTGAGQGKAPPARTNHSIVTYNEKMYLFGGTNGFQWFNDVWSYDPTANAWSQLDCIGYIPVAREGHAAALVDDVMYIFGGRTEEGADLGDLAAFRITSRRWYTFQNMGPSPSPRSGHSMTTVGKSVVVVGGEPSSASTTVNDLALVYLLDTSKIRYPNDAQIQASAQKMQGQRRPSQSEAAAAAAATSGGGVVAGSVANATRNLPSRDGSQGPPDPKKLIGSREGAVNSPTNGFRLQNNVVADPNAPPNSASKLPRVAGSSPPAGPPPQGQPPKPNGSVTSLGRVRNVSLERNEYNASPVPSSQNQSPVKESEPSALNGRRTPTQQPPKVAPPPRPEPAPAPAAAELGKIRPPRQRGQGSVDSSTEPGLKAVVNRPTSPPPPTRQTSNPLSRRSSGRNSQTVALLKELDSARNRNAWYASELELARKAGYVSNTSLSPILESRATETFDDEDKPLIEALLAMRAELANVQSSVDRQAILAAKQIAEAEKQRDAAIQEAVYAKAKLAAHISGSPSVTQMNNLGGGDGDDRTGEINRKLATALNSQKDLQAQIDRLNAEVEAERRARRLADDTANAAQRRMVELETFKQQNSSEVERLKAELHHAQREARERAVEAAEAVAASQMLRVDKDEFEGKYKEALGTSTATGDTLDSLRDAILASAEMKTLLEKKLEDERAQREQIESKLNKLKQEHEARTAELVSATQRLRDAEELVEKHANEAKTHRQAVLSGLDKISSARNVAKSSSGGDSDRILALQGQLTAANALVKKYQQEADTASDRLRSAEERIAGLEAYQEQSSREGVTIRRQLQNALRETQSLQALSSDLKHQLANQQLETNAMTVQHNTLKDILSERGISPTTTAAARSRGSPRGGSPEQSRLRELEAQLAAANSAHDETKQTFAVQANDSREKLAQLESDYQSAVHYVKGTEKMLKQLKEQLARYKADNTRLKTEVEELEDKVEEAEAATSAARDTAPEGWEAERASLVRKVDALQAEMQGTQVQLEKQLQQVRKELEGVRRERDTAVHSGEDAAARLTSSRRDFDQLQQENALLERRALDAEQKVSLLLDQVESSVDNYRRRSRQVVSMGSDTFRDVGGGGGNGASAAGSGPHYHNNNNNNNHPAGANGGSGGMHHQHHHHATDAGRGGGGAIGGGPVTGGGIGNHARNESSETGSVYGSLGDARNSTALDNLANELETLRSRWENTTSEHYRLSNAFDFDTHPAVAGTGSGAAGGKKDGGKDDDAGLGLSESLADWRKRLDG